jgi:hypothetical protein
MYVRLIVSDFGYKYRGAWPPYSKLRLVIQIFNLTFTASKM